MFGPYRILISFLSTSIYFSFLQILIFSFLVSSVVLHYKTDL